LVKRTIQIIFYLFCLWTFLIIFQPFLPSSVAGIIQAVIPQAVPTANKRGTGTIFARATSTTPASAGSTYCDDGSGNLVTSGCSGGGGGGAAGANLFSTTNSTTVTAASDTTLIGTVSGSTTVAANTWTAGSVTEISAQGYYSTPAAARTLNVKLNIGGSTRISTGAITVIPSVSLGVWKLHCLVTTRTTGMSGTQIANCQFVASGTTLTAGDVAPMQTSSTWTIDTTVGQAIDLTAAWDATTGSPTISSSNVAAWIPGAPVTSVNGLTGAVTVTGGSSITQGTWAALPATCTTSDLYYVTDSFYTARCSATNTWSAFVPAGGTGLVTVPPSAGWSWDNQGSSTIDAAHGFQHLFGPRTTAVALSARYRTAPGTPYTITILLRADVRGLDSTSTSLINAGFMSIFRQSTTGKIIAWGYIGDSNGSNFLTNKWTTSTSISGNYTALSSTNPVATGYPYQSFTWLRMADDGVNLTWSFSLDGQYFQQFDQRARGDFMTLSGGVTGPDQIGFAVYNNGDGIVLDIISWAQS
jgi:hypothetical protein